MPRMEIDHERVSSRRTEMGVQRVKSNPFYEEPVVDSRHGFWQGRPIIGRDCRINRGVYLGGNAREAIVVDDEKQPELEEIYQLLISRIESKGGDFKYYSLREVFDLVLEKMPYNSAKVDSIHRNYGGEPDQKIGLNRYLKSHAGVCRHQALLAAYLLEKLVDDGYLGGKVSVDRNAILGLGGHAWARYTTSWGKVVILDIAQNCFGSLDKLKKEGTHWFYQRPEDL